MREDCVVKLYGRSSSAIYELYELIKEDLQPNMSTNKAVPGMCKLRALNFFSIRHISAHFSCSLNQFLKALLKHSGKLINFPWSDAEQHAVKADFYAVGQILNVLGAIGCTHIAMTAPQCFEEYYRNQKIFHSLNVQMICDSKLTIMNVNASFPGSTHDSLFCSSQQFAICLRELFQALGCWVMLDMGICRGNSPPSPIHMVMLDIGTCHGYSPPSPIHIVLLKGGIKGPAKRPVVIERTFGVLKSCFRCLQRGKCSMCLVQ
ncbi:putative nuclease HARBI1 [Pseudophryne corroboree]|uniref:putative nuclease HARBI1 n=1 Tax=Pseudophryne corroboree TaxID=495146 RepID=UPI0030817A7F